MRVYGLGVDRVGLVNKPDTQFNKWAMSDVHKRISSPIILAQRP